jgi:DNA (cytosine-5)-methyltransferase 1
MTLRHASFFSGAGGLDIGFERAGIRTVSHSEIDPYASAVLKRHWPDTPNLGDITAINWEDIPNAEIWSGGFPCQDLSNAGKRAGFGGQRSSLAFTFLDLVERARPRWVVLENVAGLFTSNNGADFRRLIGEIAELGYGVAWRVLDARHFGVAQRRRRVFIVCNRDDAFNGVGAKRAAEVLVECQGGCGHIAAGESSGENSPGIVADGVGTIGTIIAGIDRGTGTTQDELFVGYGDRKPAVNSSADTRGNGTVDGVARRVDNRGIVGQTDDGAVRPETEMTDPRRVGNFELWDFPPDAVNPTLNARRARDQIAYSEIPVLSFPSRFGSNANVTEDQAQSFAHNAGAPAVMVGASYDGINQKFDGDGAHRTLRVGRDSSDFVVAEPNTVDNDAMLPVGLDGHRYRCCGNGVVAPVAEWIGRRIVAVDAKYLAEGGANG